MLSLRLELLVLQPRGSSVEVRPNCVRARAHEPEPRLAPALVLSASAPDSFFEVLVDFFKENS